MEINYFGPIVEETFWEKVSSKTTQLFRQWLRRCPHTTEIGSSILPGATEIGMLRSSSPVKDVGFSSR